MIHEFVLFDLPDTEEAKESFTMWLGTHPKGTSATYINKNVIKKVYVKRLIGE
jgi:hypothetical protein